MFVGATTLFVLWGLREKAFNEANGLNLAALAGRGDEIADGADFDGAGLGRRDFRGDFDRFIHIDCVDQIETGEAFLGFGEGSVANGEFTVADAYAFCGADGLKSFGSEAAARFAEGLVVGHAGIVGHGGDVFFFTVDEAEVFQREISF